MYFQEAFQLLLKGKILTVENMEYSLCSNYPPRIVSRPKGKEDGNWSDEMRGYFLFTLASNLWEVAHEDN
jgi:hypothetical protein